MANRTERRTYDGVITKWQQVLRTADPQYIKDVLLMKKLGRRGDPVRFHPLSMRSRRLLTVEFLPGLS